MQFSEISNATKVSPNGNEDFSFKYFKNCLIDVTADVEQFPKLIKLFLGSYDILDSELTKLMNSYGTFINDNIPNELEQTVGIWPSTSFLLKIRVKKLYIIGFSKFYYDLFFDTLDKVLHALNGTIATLENLETDVTIIVDNLGTYSKDAEGVIGIEL